MFTMDDCSRYRRLAKIGIYGHQPGVAAHVKTTQEEDQCMVEGMIAQKVGSSPKSNQAYKDFLRAKTEDSQLTIRVRIARMATKSIVRWKRVRIKEGQQDDQSKERTDQPAYVSRLLTCSVCYEQQETRWMQLRTTNGFRAIPCKHCKFQEYTAKTKCQCEVRWHHCPLHRIDPPTHSSRRGWSKARGTFNIKTTNVVVAKSSLRKAPLTEERTNTAMKG